MLLIDFNHSFVIAIDRMFEILHVDVCNGQLCKELWWTFIYYYGYLRLQMPSPPLIMDQLAIKDFFKKNYPSN
jgi:hypothetical protein